MVITLQIAPFWNRFERFGIGTQLGSYQNGHKPPLFNHRSG